MGPKSAFTAIIQKLQKSGFHVVNVPQKIALTFSKRQAVRIFCTINDSIRYACALRPTGDGGFYINVATAILKKGRLSLGQKINVNIQKDTTEYGHKMPKELKELLNQDEEGKKYWDQVPNSAQRNMIYYIAQAKSIEKRIERSLLFVNRLKNTKGNWKSN
ncbi:hypothetical protein BH10BAC4_BH10BAC4_20680 [soil metagenome]